MAEKKFIVSGGITTLLAHEVGHAQSDLHPTFIRATQ
jgi:hypothetical protein